jgi:hypothetical protein
MNLQISIQFQHKAFQGDASPYGGLCAFYRGETLTGCLKSWIKELIQ